MSSGTNAGRPLALNSCKCHLESLHFPPRHVGTSTRRHICIHRLIPSTRDSATLRRLIIPHFHTPFRRQANHTFTLAFPANQSEHKISSPHHHPLPLSAATPRPPYGRPAVFPLLSGLGENVALRKAVYDRITTTNTTNP